MADEQGRTFEDVHERLSEIVEEVSAEDISLDDALKLYEEAVKLGLSACDLSEQDLDAFLATEEEDGDCDAYILKEVETKDEESVYVLVEDDTELSAIGKVFAELLDDADIAF